jgi:hypothetical protein
MVFVKVFEGFIGLIVVGQHFVYHQNQGGLSQDGNIKDPIEGEVHRGHNGDRNQKEGGYPNPKHC